MNFFVSTDSLNISFYRLGTSEKNADSDGEANQRGRRDF